MVRILLVGGGAREHAMAAALSRTHGTVLLSVMKHRNPGIAPLAGQVLVCDETDVARVVGWAKSHRAELAVVGPEAPLAAGLVDALTEAGIPCASPTKAAARIESDKSFMRRLLAKHKVAGQLAFHPFDDLDGALRFLDQSGPVWAVKPVGLTGGKGVQVYGDHFTAVEQAMEYVRTVFATKQGGGKVQFEELAVGEEFTVMAFCDGRTVRPMPAVQDHKRLYEGDKGPNTGGMGSYSQADGLLPFLTRAEYNAAVGILQQVVDALRAEGTPYVGTLYGQFMLTTTGPRVIEFNARFGDPEAMNVLHALDTDYVAILRAMADGALGAMPAAGVRFRGVSTVVKYAVPRGYGDGKPAAGSPVLIDAAVVRGAGATVYYGSIEEQDGRLVTLTSRTLGVLGEGPGVAQAEQAVEAALRGIQGDLHVRHDIGKSALLELRVRHMAQLRAASSAPGPVASPAPAVGSVKRAPPVVPPRAPATSAVGGNRVNTRKGGSN